MLLCCSQLGRLTFTLITRSTTGREFGGSAGRKISQLAWSHRESVLLRLESVASLGPRRSSDSLKNGRQPVCHFCIAEAHNVSYRMLSDLLKSKAIWLIDVREKWEIAELGKIPGSINIPLGEVAEALQMDPAHFKEKYNQDMPSNSDHLVFSCQAGKRSSQAVAAAKSLGFSKVQQYPGGFSEWAKYESSQKQQHLK